MISTKWPLGSLEAGHICHESYENIDEIFSDFSDVLFRISEIQE